MHGRQCHFGFFCNDICGLEVLFGIKYEIFNAFASLAPQKGLGLGIFILPIGIAPLTGVWFATARIVTFTFMFTSHCKVHIRGTRSLVWN